MRREKRPKDGESCQDVIVGGKRPYVRPQLKEYGSLADLTQGQLGRYPEGFNNSYKGPTF